MGLAASASRSRASSAALAISMPAGVGAGTGERGCSEGGGGGVSSRTSPSSGASDVARLAGCGCCSSSSTACSSPSPCSAPSRSTRRVSCASRPSTTADVDAGALTSVVIVHIWASSSLPCCSSRVPKGTGGREQELEEGVCLSWADVRKAASGLSRARADV